MSRDDKLLIDGKKREEEEPKLPPISNEDLEIAAVDAFHAGTAAVQNILQASTQEVMQIHANKLNLASARANLVQALALARLCRYAGLEGLDGLGGHKDGEEQDDAGRS